MPGEVIVGAIAVTLDRTAKVGRDKFVQTLRLSSRVPLKEHIFTRSMRHPQITQPGLSIAGIKLSDRRFIDLDVRASHHLVFDLPVDRL
jgi:hypothetical protein